MEGDADAVCVLLAVLDASFIVLLDEYIFRV